MMDSTEPTDAARFFASLRKRHPRIRILVENQKGELEEVWIPPQVEDVVATLLLLSSTSDLF